MKLYSTHIKFWLPKYQTTVHKDVDIEAETSLDAAKKAQEIGKQSLNENESIYYIEVACKSGTEPIKTYDGNSLAVY